MRRGREGKGRKAALLEREFMFNRAERELRWWRGRFRRNKLLKFEMGGEEETWMMPGKSNVWKRGDVAKKGEYPKCGR